MLRKVCDYIEQNKMIEKGDRIVLGVSGGADSVCLLYVLFDICKDYEAKLIVVHVHHGIRGTEADRDEEFVKELCYRLNIEYHNFGYDVKNIAKEENLSEEEAGRKVRYQAFIETARSRKCNKVAVAHNRNDNAETVLFHLFRGTGIKGLTGIDPVRSIKAEPLNITLIRPLLCLERQEIEKYLKEHSIPYQIDTTNLSDDYSRNKIRNQILTYAAREINHNAAKHITEAAVQLKEIEEYVNRSVLQRFHSMVLIEDMVYSFQTLDFKKEDIVIQKGIIRKILEQLAGDLKDLEAKHVEKVLSLCEKQVGRILHLPYGIVAIKGYDDIKFCIDKAKENDTEMDRKQMEPVSLAIPCRIYLPQLQMYLETEVFENKKNISIPKNSCMKWFDYDKIENAVKIRTRNEGDYIQINRFGGRKKLKDYFIDRKIPKEERDHRLLVADGSHIMWIIGDGERISEKYKVDDTTNKILLMKLFHMEENENDRQS
jgi:tRNA(Ile)-lysidine synthase